MVVAGSGVVSDSASKEGAIPLPVLAVAGVYSEEIPHASDESRAARQARVTCSSTNESTPGSNLFMLAHSVARPLWPVLFFLPWLLLGVTYLIEAVRHRHPTAMQRLAFPSQRAAGVPLHPVADSRIGGSLATRSAANSMQARSLSGTYERL